MSDRPAPFDGPQWEGWTKRDNHNAVERGKGTPSFNWISVIGQLYLPDNDGSAICLWFPTPELARQVAECIFAAKKGEEVGPVSELVEALGRMVGYVASDYEGIGGKDLTDGSLTRAKALLAKYGVKS